MADDKIHDAARPMPHGSLQRLLYCDECRAVTKWVRSTPFTWRCTNCKTVRCGE